LNLKDQLADKQLELTALMGRTRDLTRHIDDLEKELEVAKRERADLVGDGFQPGGGRIGYLKRDVAKLELTITDKAKPRVIWKKAPYSDGEYVVDRVTASMLLTE
jgi:hypothetical protein